MPIGTHEFDAVPEDVRRVIAGACPKRSQYPFRMNARGDMVPRVRSVYFRDSIRARCAHVAAL